MVKRWELIIGGGDTGDKRAGAGGIETARQEDVETSSVQRVVRKAGFRVSSPLPMYFPPEKSLKKNLLLGPSKRTYLDPWYIESSQGKWEATANRRPQQWAVNKEASFLLLPFRFHLQKTKCLNKVEKERSHTLFPSLQPKSVTWWRSQRANPPQVPGAMGMANKGDEIYIRYKIWVLNWAILNLCFHHKVVEMPWHLLKISWGICSPLAKEDLT